jgi:hypothetical protein
MPDLTAERGSWAARLCRVGQTRNRHGLTSRRSANLTVIDLGRELCELSAGEWLAGRNISFDMVSLIAAGGSPPRLGRMGSGSTLLSSEEIEASERVRAMGKLAIYTPKAVVEHVIPRERLTQSWFRRRARVAGCLGLAEQTGACARSRCNSIATPVTKER